MGRRLLLHAFRTSDEQAFRAAVEVAVARQGALVLWDRQPRSDDVDMRTSHSSSVQVMYLSYWDSQAQDSVIAAVSQILECPRIDLRIQEDTLWDFSLYQGIDLLDCFSVDPSYWDDEPAHLQRWRGHPDIVSRVWRVPVHHIERYMVNWLPTFVDDDIFTYQRVGKAYESDRHQYGEAMQAFDFLHALRALDPLNLNEHGRLHSLHFPMKSVDPR